MKQQKLVAMLRVKDGILFVDRWLANLEKLVDEIVVVDNGSTDGTYEILQKQPKVVAIERTEGFHEGRDKILLYKMARERKPDWCIWLDVDEIFEKRVTREILEKMMSSKIYNAYLFRRFHLHIDEFRFEAKWSSLWYQSMPDREMWRETPEAFFSGDFIHGGDVKGIKGFKKRSNLRIKHLAHAVPGYKEYRIQKYNEAIALDSDPERIAMYKKNLSFELDEKLKTWQWFEYNERPYIVKMQNLFFNILMMLKYLILIPRKVKKILIANG